MNKKLLRKLTLSAVTLGVAAVSATTSTFAWFTTNGTVTASTVSGTVKASDVLALIKSPTGWDSNGTAKYDGSYTWNSESTTYDTATTTSAQTFLRETTLHSQGGDNTQLQPVAIDGTPHATDNVGSFKTKHASTAHDFTGDTKATDYIHYQFVIALSSLDTNKTYNVNMQLPALSQISHTQYLLADAGSNATKGSTLTFKIEDALSIGIKNTIVTSGNYGVTTAPSVTSGSQFKNDATGNYHAIAEIGANNAKGDAIAYYNAVYGSSISLPDNYATNYGSGETKNVWYSSGSTATAKTIYSITGVSEAVIATDLYFFIDGWDYQCFNAIGGLKLFNDGAKIEFEVEKQS